MQRNPSGLKDPLYFRKGILIILDVLEDLIGNHIIERMILEGNAVRRVVQGPDPLAWSSEFTSKVTAIGIEPNADKRLYKLSLSAS